MLQRIFYNWTVIRFIYLVLGVYVIIESIQLNQYVGILLGAYFAAMGLFAFGCAAGNCNYQNSKDISNLDKNNLNIDYEEIKNK